MRKLLLAISACIILIGNGCRTTPTTPTITTITTKALSDKCMIRAFTYAGADEVYISSIIIEYRKNNQNYTFDDLWALYEKDYLKNTADWWVNNQHKSIKLLFKYYRKNTKMLKIKQLPKDNLYKEKK